MRSLVLIGHGSHLNGDSAAAVARYAELLRTQNLFDEVIEAYWKEEPSLRQVLRTTASSDVTLIPLFISEGYFTETVIPRELGLGHQGPVPPEGVGRVIGGRTVRYTLPYGVHPRMAEVILERAREVLPELEEVGQETALIVLGHGTSRNDNSRRVIVRNAERLRERGLFAEVHALFLDEDPRVLSWPERVRAPRVVIVPFFASEGWHTQETIPEELGLRGPQTVFLETPHGPQTVYYAAPVGTHPAVAEVILQLAAEAHGAGDRGGDTEPNHHEAWATFQALAEGGTRVGEVMITPHGGLFELRHMLDEGRPSAELVTFVTPEGLRSKVRRDDGGRHRPVQTLRTLPRGWRAVLNERDLRLGMHFVYPAVVEESYAHHHRNLHCTPWPSTARRQTGLYAKVQRATPDQVEAVARELCSGCLRTRLWGGETLSATFFAGVPGGLPCAEACTCFVAAVREKVGGRAAE